MKVDLKPLLEILFGSIGVIVVGIILPQVVVGMIAGAVAMWFLKKPLRHLLHMDKQLPVNPDNLEDAPYVKGLKTRITRLEAEMRAMHQVVDAKEMKPRTKRNSPTSSSL